MIYLATYTDGRDIKRKRFPSDDRMTAYATALNRTPRGYTLFNLRKTKEQKTK